MNNALLTKLSAFASLIIDLDAEHEGVKSETAEIIELQFAVRDFTKLTELAAGVVDYLDFCSIRIDYRIHDGAGVLTLTNDGYLFVEQVRSKDDRLTLAPVDPELFKAVETEFAQLDVSDSQLQIENFVAGLNKLRGEVSVELNFSISVDKQSLVMRCSLPPETLVCLFFFTKHLEKILAGPLRLLEQDLGFDAPVFALFLVADLEHPLVGQHSAFLGRSEWREIEAHISQTAIVAANSHIRSFVHFRKEQVISDFNLQFAIPSMFDFEGSSLEHAFNVSKSGLSLASLANRVQNVQGEPLFEFYGVKYAAVSMGPVTQEGSLALCRLCLWTYENFSSDKLQISRHVISAQLSDIASQNFSYLQGHSNNILEVSKSNLSIYLQKNAEHFLAKRAEIIDRLHKFAQSIADNVSELTSGLVDNLYRTAGIGLGLLAAYFVNPAVSLLIIPWAVGAVVLYLLVVNFYVLLGIFVRYRQSMSSIKAVKKHFSGFIGTTELHEIEGRLIGRAVWAFRVFFAIANIFYITTAAIAVKVGLLVLNFL